MLRRSLLCVSLCLPSWRFRLEAWPASQPSVRGAEALPWRRMTDHPSLRSAQWYGGRDRNAYLHRAWMRRGMPANAFEGTFSTGNVYFRNLANDSNYGFWLGFSSNSLIARNDIWRSRSDGIAIEQGANNRIELNEILFLDHFF